MPSLAAYGEQMQSHEKSHRPGRPRASQQPAPAQSVRAAGAARLLGIGESTFWRWQKEREGMPAPRRIGPKTTVFDVAELIAWRDAQGAGK
jgi:prophage regulatory protein